jgi:hypothetical protein
MAPRDGRIGVLQVVSLEAARRRPTETAYGGTNPMNDDESNRHIRGILSPGSSASVASVANQENTALHAHNLPAAHRFDPFFHPFDPFLSVSKVVNALNRAALDLNGNCRSGWR